MTSRFKQMNAGVRAQRMALFVMSSALVLGMAVVPANADNHHHYDGRHYDNHHYDRRVERPVYRPADRGYTGGYYAPPPVVYDQGYNNAPPIVFNIGL